MAIRLGSTAVAAGGIVTVVVTGQPGTAVSLLAYSKPSSVYRIVRTGRITSAGTITFLVAPTTNTRLYARTDGGSSSSAVVNVRTSVTLAAASSAGSVTFAGAVRPARSGVLVVISRVAVNGSLTAFGQVRTDRGGRFLVTRSSGAGTLRFRASTRTDTVNATGTSQAISIVVPGRRVGAAAPRAAAPVVVPRAAPVAAPRRTAAPQPTGPFANCTQARAAGAVNIRRGSPGYSAKLDRDNDGIACEG